jgi:hypothetical protein
VIIRAISESRLKGGCRQDCLPHNWSENDRRRKAIGCPTKTVNEYS